MLVAAAQTPHFEKAVSSALDCMNSFAKEAEGKGVALLCFPECFLQGYLTEPDAANEVAIDFSSRDFALLLESFPKRGPVLVVGMIERQHDRLFNTALVVQSGRPMAVTVSSTC